MPTNLGALPSDKPIPNARVQIKLPAAYGASQVSNANNGQKSGDGAGGYMQIQYQPTYTCLWVVRSNFIACGVNGGWQRMDFDIALEPADLDGQTFGCQTVTECYDSTTVGWNGWAGYAVFRLGAGTLYTAFLRHGYSSGGVQQIYYHPEYMRLIGRVVGEGAI
jgi:hypothetical protein